MSISNIAWKAEHDLEMYAFLSKHGFSGIEIAPTRIFAENPYEHLAQAREFSLSLKDQYGLMISSMQSIWYGRSENLFRSDAEREVLIEYTQKAILFAQAISCENLVFGCPKNRNIPGQEYLPIAIEFFREVGSFATCHGVILAIEPNPPIYNTNFINQTSEAFEICRLIENPGIKVNVDIGTMLHYQENLELVQKNIGLVNHIHISEPGLGAIMEREIHQRVLQLDYKKWVSIEMKDSGDLEPVKKAVSYLEKIAHDL